MILDGFSFIFVWFGSKAAPTEKELALDTVLVGLFHFRASQNSNRNSEAQNRKHAHTNYKPQTTSHKPQATN